MRSLPGASGAPRGATADRETPDSLASTVSLNSSQMTFVLTDEDHMDQSFSSLSPAASSSRIRSPAKKQDAHHHASRPETNREAARWDHPVPDEISPPLSPAAPSTMSPATGASTPPVLGLSGPASTLSLSSSRPASLAGSLSDDRSSLSPSVPALPGLGTASAAANDPNQQQSNATNHQLIMPTLSVPSRKPFTEVGRSLGRMKLLVAGHPGIGKTSLIKSITQHCAHIAHVDPTTLPGPARRKSQSFPNRIIPPNDLVTPGVKEILASTKPYPQWWANLAQGEISTSHHSNGDVIFERNLCFVDTTIDGPGTHKETVPHYIDEHLRKCSFKDLGDVDVLNTLSSGGGVLVDAVIYMTASSGLTDSDIQILRRLEARTSIIPVLGRADQLSPAQIESSKSHVDRQLTEAGIAPFAFDEQPTGDDEAKSIYAVSNAPDPDRDNMDASVLMSSGYMPPLVSTDLSDLMNKIFSVDGSSQLRHATARKLLRWRKSNAFPAQSSVDTADWRGMALVPKGCQALCLSGDHVTSIRTRSRGRAKGYDWPGLHLVDWAADLQRSLWKERTLLLHEHSLMQQHEAQLRERRGRRAPVSGKAVATKHRLEDAQAHCLQKSPHANALQDGWQSSPQQDPLGILSMASQLSIRTGWQTLEFAGSLGVASYVALRLWLG